MGGNLGRLINSYNRTSKFFVGNVRAHTSHAQTQTHTHTEISKVQDDEVGDGTTSVTMLACELLRVSVCVWSALVSPLLRWVNFTLKL